MLTTEIVVTGVRTQMGLTFESETVVLTAGTFLSNLIHIGLQNYTTRSRGRSGHDDAGTAQVGLPQSRQDQHAAHRQQDDRLLEVGVQPGDDPAPVFGFMGNRAMHPASGAVLDHAHQQAHAMGLDRGPCWHRTSSGVRARALPEHRGQDQPLRRQGQPRRSLSSPRGPDDANRGLPGRRLDLAAVRLVQLAADPVDGGARQTHILRPGYAIGYDYFDPRQLQIRRLEPRAIGGPVLRPARSMSATGYEEAAARGLLAERQRRAREGAGPEPAWRPRADAGLPGRAGGRPDHAEGVERGRTACSPAAPEYRLQLREDNADLRPRPSSGTDLEAWWTTPAGTRSIASATPWRG